MNERLKTFAKKTCKDCRQLRRVIPTLVEDPALVDEVRQNGPAPLLPPELCTGLLAFESDGLLSRE